MSYEKTAKGVQDITQIKNIKNLLLKEGFTTYEIEKIMWENWFNVFHRVAFA